MSFLELGFDILDILDDRIDIDTVRTLAELILDNLLDEFHIDTVRREHSLTLRAELVATTTCLDRLSSFEESHEGILDRTEYSCRSARTRVGATTHELGHEEYRKEG